MKRILAVLLTAVLCVLPAAAFAAGTCAVTTTWIPGQNVKRVQVAWTSATGGEVWCELGEAVNGKVFSVKTDPAAGDDAPTDNYDAYVKDYDSSFNYLSTTLENRDTASVEMIAPADVPMYESVGFSVSAAGDLNKGDCFLYIEVPK
jgi:hypothetical protein